MSVSEIQIFHVTAEDDRKMVSQALHGWLGSSWHQARKLVLTRRVQINGNLVDDERRRLNPGDVVRVLPHPQAPLPKVEDVRLQFFDEYVVVVEKPAGFTSVREHSDGAKRDRLQTVDEILPELIGGRLGLPRERRIKLPKVIPVHRLDRDTSGLMVFARTAGAEQHLSQQFRKHAIRRKYIAVVHGDFTEPKTFESRFVEDRGDGLRGSTTAEEGGDRAVTHVKPIERLGSYTVVECRLETGRTHQIRIHLSEAGHFLCGDKIYFKPLGQPPLPDDSGAPRLALHAASLGFTHPNDREPMDFEMAPPRDFTEFLHRLGSKLFKDETREAKKRRK
jgi:23S rRNA pseudouridine1911/1915/1917 synthase